MVVHFAQFYIEPAATYPFTYHLQLFLSEVVSAKLVMSEKYKKRFGPDFELMFRISAKRSLSENEVRGPTVFKKAHDVEYSIFLPFDVIAKKPDQITWALRYLFQGVYQVLETWDIDTKPLRASEDSIIQRTHDDPIMISGG